MELHDVCEQLDEKLLDFFDVIGQIYPEQAKLEQYMRDGYFNLSRARYSMGQKSVSALQLPDRDMTPLVTVDINKTNNKFSCQNASKDVKKKSEKDDVRKRNVNKKSKSDVMIETVGKTDVDNEAPVQDKSAGSGVEDPIKWFGVLVPQALRRSQSSFQDAASISITVANLKQQLESIRKEYKTLMGKKMELISNQD